MNYFGAIDWLIIFLYLVGIIALGLWFSRSQKNTRDYFLGSRNVPWWGVGLSIVATETSALTFIGVPAIAFGTNLTFLQIILGYVIARIILAVILMPHYFRGEIYSPYQLLTNSFGPAAGRLAGGFFLLSGTLAAGVRVYVTCIPIQLLLGINVLPAILLFVILSLAYTYAGGIKAVIWTEVVQFGLFVVGGLFTLGFICSQLDGGFPAALAEAGQAGKLHWLNAKFSLSLPFNLWMGLVGATVQVMSSHGADQLIAQRVLTCKSVADGRGALVLSAVIIFPLFALFMVIGIMLWVFYQHSPLAIPLPANQAGFTQNDYIYPIFILTEMPSVFKGFLIVGILSAAMSSVSAALSALASVSTMDFLKGLSRRPQSDSYYLRLSRYSTVFWAIILILVAYTSREVVLVLNWAFSLNGLTSGAMLGGVLLALFFSKSRALPVILGMSVALAVMFSIHFLGGNRIAWPWYTLIGTATTLAVSWFAHSAAQWISRESRLRLIARK